MRFSLPLAIAAAVLPLSVQAGMYGQPVLNLDAKTFKKVMATEHAAMVAFVAPWCGHCKNLGPEYTSAASSLSPLIPFYAIDCDDAGNKALCAEYQIQGFPTIKAFPRAGKGAAKDYQGERKRGALVEYAKTLVPDRVKKLRIATEGSKVEPVIQAFLDEKSNLPHVLLVHPSAPSIPFLWKVLAHRLSGKMHLAYIRDTTSHSILTSLGIFDSADTTKDGTRVVAWPGGVQERSNLTEYQGALKFNALLEWLQAQLDGKPASSTSSSESSSGKTQQKPVKAPEPIPNANGQGETKAKQASDAAARKAKMDEAERRDRERRERAAQAAAARPPVEDVDASPVEEAAEAVPEGSAEQEQVQSDGVEGVAEPVPEQVPVPGEEAVTAGQEGVDSEQTVQVHEEL
ncbi:protein disulfide-isomerase domain [Kwoniella shandongensis]|uniref:Protein disulfide-isomerase domain n=1 Tax=Kwoniella shandongensis TaxID=1734106 RepID=A0AAJ8MW20_9TREE